MGTKADIRKQFLGIRKKLSQEEWEERTNKIMQKVVTHPFFLENTIVFCYIDYRKEVGTRKLIEHAWACKKRVAVPRIEEGQMHFYQIDSWDDLTPGQFGILEPTTRNCLDWEQGLMIMPLAACDMHCNRIGYGGGYYDRFLAKYREKQTIGLAFSIQVVDSIQTELHDIKPMIIFTEDMTYDAEHTNRSNVVS